MKALNKCEICGFEHEKEPICPETKKCPSCGTILLLHDRRKYCSEPCKNAKREQNGRLVIAHLEAYINNL